MDAKTDQRIKSQPIAPSDAGEDNWHARLLASLLDAGVQLAPRPPSAQIVRPILGLVAVFFISAFFALFLLIWFAQPAPNPSVEKSEALIKVILWLVWAGIFLFVLRRIANKLLRRLWQMRAHTAEEELRRNSCRRPVFYLRPFSLDDLIDQPTEGERLGITRPAATSEQRLARHLSRCGPVVAVGRLGEELPPLGAARFYVGHALWQQKVAEVAKASQMVIVATGVTEGLRWELTHLTESLPPEKLVLWAHPHILSSDQLRRIMDPDAIPPEVHPLLLDTAEWEREVEWTRFREAFSKEFPHPLPEQLGETRFIYFDAEWRPHGIAPLQQGLKTLFSNPQDLALRALLKMRCPRQQRRRGLAVASFLLAIVGIPLLLFGWMTPHSPLNLGFAVGLSLISLGIDFLGIILGAVSLAQINKNPTWLVGRGYAVAGLILGLFGAVNWLFFLLDWLAKSY